MMCATIIVAELFLQVNQNKPGLCNSELERRLEEFHLIEEVLPKVPSFARRTTPARNPEYGLRNFEVVILSEAGRPSHVEGELRMPGSLWLVRHFQCFRSGILQSPRRSRLCSPALGRPGGAWPLQARPMAQREQYTCLFSAMRCARACRMASWKSSFSSGLV